MSGGWVDLSTKVHEQVMLCLSESELDVAEFRRRRSDGSYEYEFCAHIQSGWNTLATVEIRAGSSHIVGEASGRVPKNLLVSNELHAGWRRSKGTYEEEPGHIEFTLADFSKADRIAEFFDGLGAFARACKAAAS